MISYRVGRHLGRTIYRQNSEDPSEHDPLIGVMDTPELGEQVAAALNHVASCPHACETREGEPK